MLYYSLVSRVLQTGEIQKSSKKFFQEDLYSSLLKLKMTERLVPSITKVSGSRLTKNQFISMNGVAHRQLMKNKFYKSVLWKKSFHWIFFISHVLGTLDTKESLGICQILGNIFFSWAGVYKSVKYRAERIVRDAAKIDLGWVEVVVVMLTLCFMY